MKVRVSNIQRFCLHDGPGIRTTVFFKGCNLTCPWCANPENIDFEPTPYFDELKKEKGVFGQDIEVSELFEEIMKDREYYKFNNGGVTLSGGEPLLQIKKMEQLLKKLKENNINICVETALQVPSELVELAIKYVDEFIVDIKILDSVICKEVLHGDIDLYYKNLDILSENNKISILRIPLINEYTLNDENIEKILELLKKYKFEKIEIFKIHNLAESKYRMLERKIPNFSKVNDFKVKQVFEKIKKLGYRIEIINI